MSRSPVEKEKKTRNRLGILRLTCTEPATDAELKLALLLPLLLMLLRLALPFPFPFPLLSFSRSLGTTEILLLFSGNSILAKLPAELASPPFKSEFSL